MTLVTDPKHYEKIDKKGSVRILTTLSTAVILASINAYSESAAGKGLIILLTGFVMAGFYSAMHYLSHGSVFKDQRKNRIWGLVFSGLLLQNFSLYKYFHLKHHQFTGVEGDTEPGGDLRSLAHYLFYALNWDYFAAFIRMSAMAMLGYFPEFVSRRSQRQDVKVDAVIQAVGIVIVITLTIYFPATMLTVYWLPLQIAMTLNFFLAFGEHYGCEKSRDPFANTRCFGQKSTIFEWFHWNANYHAEHHLFPRATPWSLKDIHREYGELFRYGAISYLKLNTKTALGLFRDGKILVRPDLKGTPDFFYPLTKEM